MEYSVGDVIEVNSRKTGQPARRGQVTAVVNPTRPRLRVRWEDERESLLYPYGGNIRVVGRKGE
ncbi:MAG: DUF1918 domain-containing protein [Egibacteraceae bacterium]